MIVPRIVVDSNVVISGLLFGGPPARVLSHLIEGSVLCFTSLPILDEIRNVLRRPKFGLSPEQSLSFVEELHALCRVVNPTERVHVIEADPDDNIVLECAMAANASIIVSGDSHLLDLGQWRDIQILSPSDFLKTIESSKNLSRES